MKIEVVRLNNGQFVARPKNSLGTCGWSPFAWTACFDSTAAKALRKFEQVHEKQIKEMKSALIKGV
jgi:hypothetical protein